MNKNPRVKSVLAPSNVFPLTDEHNDGSYSDLMNCVDCSNHLAPFNSILIDGHSRIAFLKRELEWASDKGIVVLHNSYREYFHAALVNFPNQVIFH